MIDWIFFRNPWHPCGVYCNLSDWPSRTGERYFMNFYDLLTSYLLTSYLLNYLSLTYFPLTYLLLTSDLLLLTYLLLTYVLISYLISYLITYLLYLLTHSMEKSPSWEANSFSASQEIPHILWNPKVHYRIHKCPPTVPILNLLDPVHIPTSHFLKIFWCYRSRKVNDT
jgi:hypothetical protein